ncbi:MAG TPA: hypothetical protein VN841_17535 [Bryobacteraceae bacterium]|nr:hypothetical protein [Bryobacteraceae bacterium]
MLPSTVSIPAFLFANNTAAVLQGWVDSLTDDTFKGIHHLAPFDYAILVPYFAVLAVLSMYGLHRYEMIRGYMKNRVRWRTQPPQRFEKLPRVTVQLCATSSCG